MAKSRSRSPRWKPRPQFHRSPEQHRQRRLSDEGFHRDARRPIHWEDDRHGHNNPRMAPHNRFNDTPFENNFFPQNPRRSPPLEPTDRLRRPYSPERHGESSRRFSPKYPEDIPHRDNNHNFYHHRHQGRNIQDDVNGLREGRREDSFHGPPRREPDWDRRENENHWNKEGHREQYVSPHRRNSQERGFIPKRYPEDRNFREHVQPPKRPRETEELDHRPLPRNSNWKPDHTFRPSHGKDWSKDTGFRNPNPIIHRANSGEFTKIEYDYSHKSPSYVGVGLPLPDGYIDKHNRLEERKPVPAKSSHHSKPSDNPVRERGKFASERVPQPPPPKYDPKRCPNRDKAYYKSDNTPKPHNPKLKERGRNENSPHKEQSPPRVQHDQSSNSSASKTAFKNIPSTETITVNLDVKKPVDKYRREMSTVDRQMSQDLVVSGGKETFRPVFDHLDATTPGVPVIPKTEFTHEIITIIHEVKANHFQPSDITLHERFSKLQTESNKKNQNLNAIPLQTNPEIHRRIDISLEDLQKKHVDRTDVLMPSKRVIEDPNDLRHDIERRRKERLQVGENGGDVGFQEREATSSYYRPQNHESEYHVSSRLHRPPFRKSIGRPPGSYYRGKPNHFFSSQNCFENSDEMRRPYTGRGDGAPGV
uniref:BCLAF1 and THRAP3 family member 3 n=1 Tax=Leptobrachium leishanense TaxID=445787 RepID=A0A8C5P8H7_9ANUR